MSYYRFHEDDIFINTLEAYPQYSYFVHSGTIYINNVPHLPGANSDNSIGVPKGYISLYEYNVDRPTNSKIYPFLEKDGKKHIFKKVKNSLYNTELLYGEQLTSSYNLSASISRDYYSTSTRSRISALRNALDHYAYLSPHYQYSSSFGNKDTQNINLISIPSILYGSEIKKGSVSLKYFITGSLIGELQDRNRNGELVQIGPTGSTGSGSVAGVVLYKEGFIILTGSWSLDDKNIAYETTGNSKWIYFNYGANDGNTVNSSTTLLSSSYVLEYKGTTHTQVLTMLAHAKYGELNHSNNPTFVSSSDLRRTSERQQQYTELPKEIKNIVHSDFVDEAPAFKKVTYISKIGIFDENKKLIGIAKVATPVRKTEEKQYTFKLNLDI